MKPFLLYCILFFWPLIRPVLLVGYMLWLLPGAILREYREKE